jgi:hypothetical protein
VLTYHVVNGTVGYSSSLENGTTLQTLNGGDLTITVGEDGSVWVNSARVVVPNVLVANGVVHVIDQYVFFFLSSSSSFPLSPVLLSTPFFSYTVTSHHITSHTVIKQTKTLTPHTTSVLNPAATSGPTTSATAGSPAFTGATSASDIPFTSGLPTPTTTINAESEGPGAAPTGAAAPLQTGAVGAAALFGAGAAAMLVGY